MIFFSSQSLCTVVLWLPETLWRRRRTGRLKSLVRGLLGFAGDSGVSDLSRLQLAASDVPRGGSVPFTGPPVRLPHVGTDVIQLCHVLCDCSRIDLWVGDILRGHLGLWSPSGICWWSANLLCDSQGRPQTQPLPLELSLGAADQRDARGGGRDVGRGLSTCCRGSLEHEWPGWVSVQARALSPRGQGLVRLAAGGIGLRSRLRAVW